MTTVKASVISTLGRARERLEGRFYPRARADLEHEFLVAYERCRPYTMTSLARMYGLYQGVHYVAREQIPGDIVECGVWRGGSSMLAALTLIAAGDESRGLYLYDTFAGMTAPTERDGAAAAREWTTSSADGWCYSPLEEVQGNMRATGIAEARLSFVEGKVEETIPATLPARISVLRLDTDWYESTYHELEHLYPLLSPGGVLILDDYGYWDGARRAVEEYFERIGRRPMLTRLDNCARIGLKPGP